MQTAQEVLTTAPKNMTDVYDVIARTLLDITDYNPDIFVNTMFFNTTRPAWAKDLSDSFINGVWLALTEVEKLKKIET